MNELPAQESREERKKLFPNSKSKGTSSPLLRFLPLFFFAAVVVGVVLFVVFFGVDSLPGFGDKDSDGDSENLEWKEELLVNLRSMEISWGEDQISDWEEKEAYPFDYTIPYAAYESGRFTSRKPVLKVREEILYTDDFNVELYLHHFPEFIDTDPISDDLLMEVAGELVRASVILQEAEQQGFVELDDAVFNASGKEYLDRGALITEAEELLVLNSSSVITLEQISIWFYNTEIPEIGVEAAREIAEEKITSLRSQLADGELTFQQAPKTKNTRRE